MTSNFASLNLDHVQSSFFHESLFSRNSPDSGSSSGGSLASLLGKRSIQDDPPVQGDGKEPREEDYDDEVKILTRNSAHDQVEIFRQLESSLDRTGFVSSGKDCVLRAICELKETPIHEWSLLGEVVATLLL